MNCKITSEHLISCNVVHYNYITDNIAIGDSMSSYNDFDIIVNLYLEENGCEFNQIIFENKNKIICKVGMMDHPSLDDVMLSLLCRLIPYLITYKEKKILFHCQAGISRSATVAIAYIMVLYNMTVKEAYDMVISKRKVKPNTGFMKALENFYNIISIKY